MSDPLSGFRILLTRTGSLADELRVLGADVRVAEVTKFEVVDHEVDATGFDWVVFTSARAVHYARVSLIGGPRIASVGPATTAAIECEGGRVDVEPEMHDAASLCRELIERRGIAGRRVLFPCSDLALPTVVDLLGEAGAEVTRLVVYRTVPAGCLPDAAAEPCDAVVFLSPSAVHAFAVLGGDLAAAPAVAIGPTTASALRDRGVEPKVAPTSDRAGVVAALSKLESCR